MKNFFIATGLIVLFIVFAFLGVYGLTKHIYNRTDCERFNIDNIELRTGIDVPNVIADECNCTSNNSYKTASFLLDTSQVNLADYIVKNGFSKMNGTYKKSGTNTHTNWQVGLNPESGILDVKIEYLQ